MLVGKHWLSHLLCPSPRWLCHERPARTDTQKLSAQRCYLSASNCRLCYCLCAYCVAFESRTLCGQALCRLLASSSAVFRSAREVKRYQVSDLPVMPERLWRIASLSLPRNRPSLYRTRENRVVCMYCRLVMLPSERAVRLLPSFGTRSLPAAMPENYRLFRLVRNFIEIWRLHQTTLMRKIR